MSINTPPELRSGDFLGSIANSPYKLAADSLRYNQVFFAFLDILGYRAFLQKHGDNAPPTIYSMLKNTYDFHSSTYESVRLKLLSDSILLWTEGDLPVHFWNLLNVVELIRNEFFKKGLLLRGGITLGKNFIAQDIIVSPALVEAYELEQSAKYPRILVAEAAKNKGLQSIFNTPHGTFGLQVESYFRIVDISKIQCDEDSKTIIAPFNETNGLCFLRTGLPIFYCEGDASPTEEQKKSWKAEGEADLKNLKSQVEFLRPHSSSKAEIKEKYSYLVGKYNSWIKKYLPNSDHLAIYLSDHQEIE